MPHRLHPSALEDVVAGVDVDVVLSVLEEWREANRLAQEVQASLPGEALELLEAAGPQSSDEIRVRWVGAVAGLHPSIVAGYGRLLDYVVAVVEDLAARRAPTIPPPAACAAERDRIAELEARVAELETFIAGAAAVLDAAEVD